MNKNSNLYTISYAAVMVILVAVGLALTSQLLKERKTNNENIDRMQQILRAVNIDATANTIETYNATITDAYMVAADGTIVEGSNGVGVEAPAFAFSLPSIKEAEQLPVFVATIDGEEKYILGMYGQGLWGPVWGYIALNADRNTVYGIDFSHQGETPGLGAQIVEPFFREPFKGKHIFVEGEFKSIAVVKKGSHVSGQDHVDGISGSTLTSNGVHAMLFSSLKKYEPFLIINR